MKKINFLMLFLLLQSCAHSPLDFQGERAIAEDNSCIRLTQNFTTDNATNDLDSKLIEKLKDKKLITLKEKLITIKSPPIDWINNVKKSLSYRIKNWNKNQYPLFYLDPESNIIATAKSYYSILKKESENTLTDEDKTTLQLIRQMLKDFKSYPEELDNLLHERVSLQYNIDLLKKLKLKDDTPYDFNIEILKNGKIEKEIVTIRKEDRNKDLIILNLKNKISELDGKFLKYGTIHERILKQALLKDILTIYQRELEYIVKNSNENFEIGKSALSEIETLLSSNDFSPSSYGVYKINNEIFKKEVFDVFVSDKYTKATTNQDHKVVTKFIEQIMTDKKIDEILKQSTNASVDINENKEKGISNFLKRIYLKIASMTPTQKVLAATPIGVLGYSSYQYFWFNKGTKNVTPVDKIPVPEQMDAAAHEEQIKQTQKIEEQNSNGNSEVIEVQLEKIVPKN